MSKPPQQSPRLNQDVLRHDGHANENEVTLPGDELLRLPERVLQFGTGRFLRGFIDYFVDEANRHRGFDGRVVMVSSTGSGRGRKLNEQEGFYTLVERGLEHGRRIDRCRVVGSVSRALDAQQAWDDVLDAARKPSLACITSNTTEVGIQLDEDDAPDLDPPRSFPGKLTTCLYERARHFDYAADAGLVVLPCELIEDNGDRLRDIVRELADRWDLDGRFRSWLDDHVLFCNTLVDRIVTGRPSGDEAAALRERLGYDDQLLTVCEPYHLWVVEGPASLVRRLPLLHADGGVVVTDDLTPYRTRKVRLLNGTHTTMVPVAFLAGLETVREAVEDEAVGAFTRDALYDELVPALAAEGTVDAPEARDFADDVIERFRNPFLDHAVLDITFQSTSKMRHRVVPSIRTWAADRDALPQRLLFGFAAYLRFMRGVREEDGTVYGEHDGTAYPIRDDQAAAFRDRWNGVDPQDADALRHFVDDVCSDETLWGTDLTALPGVAEAVTGHLVRLERNGARAALAEVEAPATA